MTSKTETPKTANPRAASPTRTEQEKQTVDARGARINALCDLKEIVDLATELWLNNGWYEANHKKGTKLLDALLLRRFEALLPHIYGDPCGAYQINQFPPE